MSSPSSPWPYRCPLTAHYLPSPSSLPATSQRHYIAVFRGSNNTHPDLAAVQALQVIKDSKRVAVESSGKWVKHDSAASNERYADLIQSSKYVLALGGHNPNTFRVVEAVESGSIPVIVVRKGLGECYDNWAAVYGHPIRTAYKWIPSAPFEVLPDWAELGARWDSILAKATDKHGNQILVWYQKWRQAFRDQFARQLSALV